MFSHTINGLNVIAIVYVQVGKYERIIQWMRDLIWNIQFTKERLSIAAHKLVNDAAQIKREGMDVRIDEPFLLHPIVPTKVSYGNSLLCRWSLQTSDTPHSMQQRATTMLSMPSNSITF